MAIETLKIEGRNIEILAPAMNADLFFLHAEVSEGLSELVTIEAEFLTDKRDLNHEDFLAEEIIVVMNIEDKTVRAWKGLCIECLYIGESTGMGYGEYAHYRVQVRSWPWMLTRTTDCRIFQNLTTEDIVKQIFNEYGFPDFRFKLTGSYEPREYCVQYRESDFDFISRLLEDEGMYYRFEHDWAMSSEDNRQTKVWLEIFDDSAQAEQIWGDYYIRLLDKESGQREEKDFIHKWEERRQFDSGKVTLRDYNFTKPRVDLTATRKVSAQKYSKYELFDFPGRYQVLEKGEKIAGRKLEAISAERYQVRGQGLFKQIEPGKRFGLKDHPSEPQNTDYLAVRMVHVLKQEKTDSKAIKRPKDFRLTEDDIMQSHEVTFVAQPVDVPFKPKEKTLWPKIQGVQTAVVVGPEGDEIFTDEYGRIKIQFHWDREGKNDDNSSCWVRVVTPMSGKNWGLIAVPRIGQEVVVQFEEGDPDRPLVTGMVFNADNPVPMGLPDNKTQLGFRTDCHKNDDSEAFHEFVLEDSKDGEFIRMQSEKDYRVIVKNNTEISYGTGDKDDGSLKMDVWKNTKETFGVGAGEGELSQWIQDDYTVQVIKGDYNFETEKGARYFKIADLDYLHVGADRTVKVDQNCTETVGKAFELTAKTGITLKCGGSKIEMTPSGITISAAKIEVKGQAKIDVDSPLSTVSGSGLLTLKGGLVKIN